jgi:hypothetical protein
MIPKNHCLAAALKYLRRGWSVVPVCPPDHLGVGWAHGRRCTSPGKAPLVAWKPYQDRPPTESDVRVWWATWPNANVGVVLGPVTGLVGVDLDGRSGDELLREVSRGDVPETLTFRTGKGRRLLYALPRGTAVSNRTFARNGGELRVLSAGTISVMPPSAHHSGRKYRWSARRGPDYLEPAPAPTWLCRSGVRVATDAFEVGAPIPEGQRNWRLFKLACALRRYGCTPEEIHSTIRCINKRCPPPLDEGELREIVKSTARYPPVW